MSWTVGRAGVGAGRARGLAGVAGLLVWLLLGPVRGQEANPWGLDLLSGEVVSEEGEGAPAGPALEPAPEPAPEPLGRTRRRAPACQRREPATAALVRAAGEAAGLDAG
ncbi:MAG TPA: hypothetical protein P5076_17445, partial [Myxococcota bacterium]|nr:hypothetical protein [Myxococcota bacterium]